MPIADDKQRVNVVLPKALLQEIKELATAQERSFNGMLVFMLKRQLEAERAEGSRTV